MTYASGCQPLAFIFKPIAVSVLRPDFCALGSAHYSVFAGHAQAALSAYLLSAIQGIRLEFYEIFNRFYDGSGKDFRPVEISFGSEK